MNNKRMMWIAVALVAAIALLYFYMKMQPQTVTHGQPITYPGSNPANPGGVGYSTLNG